MFFVDFCLQIGVYVCVTGGNICKCVCIYV